MHEYFYSVDFNLRNPTKFSLHFSHFSLILYEFCKSHSNQINKTKPTLPPLTRGPHPQSNRESRGSSALPRRRAERAHGGRGGRPASWAARRLARRGGGSCACGRAGARAGQRTGARAARAAVHAAWAAARRRRRRSGRDGARRLRG